MTPQGTDIVRSFPDGAGSQVCVVGSCGCRNDSRHYRLPCLVIHQCRRGVRLACHVPALCRIGQGSWRLVVRSGRTRVDQRRRRVAVPGHEAPTGSRDCDPHQGVLKRAFSSARSISAPAHVASGLGGLRVTGVAVRRALFRPGTSPARRVRQARRSRRRASGSNQAWRTNIGISSVRLGRVRSGRGDDPAGVPTVQI